MTGSGIFEEPPTAEQIIVAEIIARLPQFAAKIADTARTQLASYSELSQHEVTDNSMANMARVLAALAENRALSPQECDRLREYGERRAQQGVDLVDLQHSWRIALRLFRGELIDIGRARGLPDQVLLAMTHHMLDLVDQATIAYSAGHREVEVEMTRNDQQVRAEFVRRVLLGTLDPGGTRVLAHRYGVPIDARYHAFRVRADAPETDKGLRRWLRSRDCPAVFVTTVDDDIAGFTAASAVPRTETAMGFGPPGRLDELARSFRLAGRTLLTAQVFDLTGPIDVDRAGLLAAVAADPDIGAELVHRYLDPLGDSEQTRIIVETVERHIDAGMHIETTAELLTVHPNTVRYRISRFEHLCDADLRVPTTAARVWWAIKHRRATQR